ncbi:hypothetical protein ACERII_10615 [Evansella sp. AB-rgal1]|uniref:hypothetical protein n=1 Tax=Evansella sp. AB-rgal1 TaxID=3242696 RepID=UPI00359EC43C
MRIHQLRAKVKESKSLQIAIALMIAVIAFIYLKTFFTPGIHFEGTFLTKQDENTSETHYIGRSLSRDIQISVIRKTEKSTEVIYDLPYDFHRQYTVTVEDRSEHWQDNIKIDDEQGNILFEGGYLEDQFYLTQKNGEPLMEDFINFHINSSPFTVEYKVSLRHVADMAFFANDTIRGDFMFLVLSLFLFLVTAIDYKFPLFFFHLRNSLDVRDPEPSDFYLFMQRVSWIVLPIIGVILAIVAIV